MYCCCYSMILGGVNWKCEPLVSTCFLYALLFPYIFLLFDCFEWVLIDHIEKQRVHSELWQFRMGGSIGSVNLWYLHVFSMHWYFLISSYYLTVSNGCSVTALKSKEFTLSSGIFKWGGYILRFTWCHTDISLYLPII